MQARQPTLRDYLLPTGNSSIVFVYLFTGQVKVLLSFVVHSSSSPPAFSLLRVAFFRFMRPSLLVCLTEVVAIPMCPSLDLRTMKEGMVTSCLLTEICL
jgi:hypothetical protein